VKTTVLLLIVLLTLGLSTVPAMAGDQVVMQPLPVSCQPVGDAELCRLNGKGLRMSTTDLRQLGMCFYNKLPAETQQNVLRAYQVAKTVYTCIHGAPAVPVAGSSPADTVPAAAAAPAAASLPAAAAALAAGLRLQR
jgi:hypothetical protein